MRGSFKLTLGMGVAALVALSMPACGGDDDSGGGGGKGGSTGATGGKGGTGGGSGGSTGGSAGSSTGGSAGSSSSITCGTATCSGWKVANLIDVAPCCAGTAQDKCGATVDATIEGLIKVPQGCYEVEQEGKVDCGCPAYVFDNPLSPGEKAQFNGCCKPAGTCGYNIDITSQQGPNIGCQDSAAFADAGTPPTCTVGSETPPPDGGSCSSGGAAGASGDASTD